MPAFQVSTNLTASDDRVLHPVYLYTYMTLCAVIAFAGLTGNVLVYYVIVRVRTLHTPTNLLMLSLATADTLVCTIMIPIYLDRFYNHSISDSGVNENMCLARKFLFMLTSSGSLMSLAMVSLDRMLAIGFPFTYCCRIEKRHAILTILFVWAWCGGFCCASFYNFSKWDEILPICSAGVPRTLYLIVTPPCFYFPGLIIIMAYVKIFLVARTHHRRITSQHEAISPKHVAVVCQGFQSQHHYLETSDLERSIDSNDSRDRSRSRSSTLNSVLNNGARKIRDIGHKLSTDLRAAKTISILVGVMLFCWGPIASYYIYISSYHLETKGNDVLHGYLHDSFMILSFVNSAINPYLYSAMNVEIRKGFRKVFWNIIKKDVMAM